MSKGAARRSHCDRPCWQTSWVIGTNSLTSKEIVPGIYVKTQLIREVPGSGIPDGLRTGRRPIVMEAQRSGVLPCQSQNFFLICTLVANDNFEEGSQNGRDPSLWLMATRLFWFRPFWSRWLMYWDSRKRACYSSIFRVHQSSIGLRITLLFIVIVVGFGRQPGSSFTGHGPSRSARGDLGFLVLVDRNILEDVDIRGLFVSMQVRRGSVNS